MKKVTAAIITDSNNKILIAQRSKEDKLSLKWEFPGGKIKEGETPEECLKREIREELCLDIEVVKFYEKSIYHYDSGSIELLAYYAKVLKGTTKLLVHNDIKWVDITEITKYDFAPADIPIVEKLKRQKKADCD